MPLEIGVILPTSTADPKQPVLGDVRASARLAEELGLDSVWSTDHLMSIGPMVESTVVLATAAAVTERIRIGFNVMLLSLRPVAWVAKQIAALQYISSERLILGVGTGNPVHGDVAWRSVGLPYRDRGRLTDEALRVLPDLVAGKPTVLPNGVEAQLAPAAVMPPVFIAGNGAKAWRRAAQFGAGWAAVALTPSEVTANLRELAKLTAELGRPALRATVVAPPLSSSPSEAAEQLRDYADAGTERVILPVTGTNWQSTYEHAAEIRAALL